MNNSIFITDKLTSEFITKGLLEVFADDIDLSDLTEEQYTACKKV